MTRKIAIVGLGGTIAMSSGPRGLAPAHSVADTMAAVALPEGVEVVFRDHLAIASANLTFESLADLALLLRDEILVAVDGVVVIQGTDTIEESAFALELMLGVTGPVVVTGAMRSPAQPGADGPANLATALQAAASGPSGAGVLVAMNDEIHAARYVRKAHTTSLAAFVSGDIGPLGRVHEGRLRMHRDLLPPLGKHVPGRGTPWPKVALATIGMDQECDWLEALPDLGYTGCVLAAMGAGHVPQGLVPSLEALAARMPVVLTSRAAAGAVCERTYGFPGSEADLLARGILSGGALSALKARVLLSLCLATHDEGAEDVFVDTVQLI